MNETLKPFFTDVVVNGEVIPRTAIAAETQNHPGDKVQPASVWTKAAQALVIRTLLLQEAERRGLKGSPLSDGAERKETEEDALVRILLEDAVAYDAPTQQAVEAEWSKDPSRFRSPPLWEASHILIAFDAPHMRDAAFKRAEALIGELREQPERFAQLAMSNSQCSSRGDGGFLGQLRPGDTVPEFEAAMRALRVGEISSVPVETEHGFHVIRLDAFEEGRALPFEIVEPRIVAALEKAAWAESARKFVDELIESAEIVGTRFSSSAARTAG